MSQAELPARLDRLQASLEFLQLMTQTFSSLGYTDRETIGDAIGDLLGTYLDCQVRATLLCSPKDPEQLLIKACTGVDAATMLSEPALRVWAWAMQDRTPRALDGAQLRERWPEPPAAFTHGLACATIEIRDESVGVVVVAGKPIGAPFDDDDLSFLFVAAGLATMAFSNADAYELLDAQRELAEVRATQAAAQAREKQAALDVIDAQRREISVLSTPILQMHRDVLALPIVGNIDTARSIHMQERVMAEVARLGARFVIIDTTGVDYVDTMTADSFLRLARCTKMLGTTCILTGIQPQVAQTLVGLGVELEGLTTKTTLGDGFAECLRRLQRMN